LFDNESSRVCQTVSEALRAKSLKFRCTEVGLPLDFEWLQDLSMYLWQLEKYPRRRWCYQKPVHLVICPAGVSHHCSHFRQLRNFRQNLNTHVSYSIMPCLDVACAGRWLKTCFSTYSNKGEFSCLSVRLSGLFHIWPSAPLLSHLFVDNHPYCLIRWLNKF